MSDYKETEPKFIRQMTMRDFDRMFPNEEACRNYLLFRRWPDGVVCCVRCGNPHVYRGHGKRQWHWQCKVCGKNNRSPYRFALTTGTIFEETKMPLLTWFKVLYLMLTSKKGISALQIHRMLGTGSYRSAWYMCMRLRAGMKDPDFKKLMGIVEVDETYIGGKDRNRHWGKKSAQMRAQAGNDPLGEKVGYGKVGVIGAISRKGNVVCMVIGDAQASTSLIKRGVVGSYHHVSKKYLPLYLNEFQFRFNNRKTEDIFGVAIAGC